MTLNIKYPITAPPAVASYDYTDIASGLGFTPFYGAIDGAGNYFLTDNARINSNKAGTQNNGDIGTTYSKQIEVNFDSTVFNLPRTMKGTAIANIPIGAYKSTLGGGGYAVVTLKHYDGTTYTNIGTATGVAAGPDLSGTGDTTFHYGIQCLQITLTQQHFKKGDLLRVTVEVWWKDSSGGSWTDAGLGHDPKDRDYTLPYDGTTMKNTQLSIHIPFRIDL